MFKPRFRCVVVCACVCEFLMRYKTQTGELLVWRVLIPLLQALSIYTSTDIRRLHTHVFILHSWSKVFFQFCSYLSNNLSPECLNPRVFKLVFVLLYCQTTTRSWKLWYTHTVLLHTKWQIALTFSWLFCFSSPRAKLLDTFYKLLNCCCC